MSALSPVFDRYPSFNLQPARLAFYTSEQYDKDVETGLDPLNRNMFSANSIELKIMRPHGCADIRLVQGDATKLRAHSLSLLCLSSGQRPGRADRRP